MSHDVLIEKIRVNTGFKPRFTSPSIEHLAWHTDLVQLGPKYRVSVYCTRQVTIAIVNGAAFNIMIVFSRHGLMGTARTGKKVT